MTNKNKKIFLTVAGVAVLAIAGGMLMMRGGQENPNQTPVPGQETAATTTPAEPAEQAAEIDSDDALGIRALGDEDAPVKIEEYASLTCSHCAHFYNDTFPKLKSKYIDTGKVYFVYSDFPLNAPAMHASMIARCVPENKFFDFVETLFDEQDKWGFDPNYLAYLKTEAAERGVNGATYQSCLQNSEIQQGIVKKMEAAQAQWAISSTPTFVLNNKKVISGAVSFEQFEKEIEEALGNPVPRTEEPAPAPVVAAPAAEETTAPAPATEKTIAPGEPNPATPAEAATTEEPASEVAPAETETPADAAPAETGTAAPVTPAPSATPEESAAP